MSPEDDAFARTIGFTIGEQIREVGQRIPDPVVLGTDDSLLRVMLYELGTQLSWAIQAVDNALSAADAHDDQVFWREVQLLLTFGGTAASFIWSSPSRRKHLVQAFPGRVDDLQLLLKITGQRYEAVIALRDAVIHIDEKLEQWWIDHLGEGLGMRSMHGAQGDGTDFLSWTPESQTLSFLDEAVSLPNLRTELADLQLRSSKAFSYMLFVDEVNDGER